MVRLLVRPFDSVLLQVEQIALSETPVAASLGPASCEPHLMSRKHISQWKHTEVALAKC